MTTLSGVLLAVLAQRLAELAYARRNERRLRAAGGVELGRGHYPLFILLHGGWLGTIWFAADPAGTPSWPLLAAFLLLQAGRLWVIVTLGPYWTTRVITVPGAPLLRHGPFRFCRHPNYLVVAAEIAVLPLVFDLIWTAVVFSLANAALLYHRIRIEDAGLAPRRAARGEYRS